MNKFIWEQIDTYTYRAKIPGGWLVRYCEDVMTLFDPERMAAGGYEFRSSICFVPDPTHGWKLVDEVRKSEEEERGKQTLDTSTS